MDSLVFSHLRSRGAGADDSALATACDLASPIVSIATTPIVGSLQFYHLNTIVSGACAAFSTAVILSLMYQHATHLSRVNEQLHVLRICAFIPVYSIGIFLMVLAPRVYIYLLSFLVIYEAYALAYFYLLLCEILSEPDSGGSSSDVQRATFLAPLAAHARRAGRSVADKKGFFSPFQRFRRHWVLVFQCPPLTVVLMVATVSTQATGYYCLTASDAAHAHLYLIVVQIASMVGAVIGVVHTYAPLRRELKEHRALSKLWAFKLLIFLQVAQSLAFSILDGIDPPSIADSEFLSSTDVLIGLPLLIVSCELVFFAVFFHYAYSVTPYKLTSEEKGAGQTYSIHGWQVWWEVLKIHDLIAATKFMTRIFKEAQLLELEIQMGEGSCDANTQFQPQSEGAGGGVQKRWAPTKTESGNDSSVVVGWAENARSVA
ncbi:organic solute transporter Ostalpha-domain-containing protein [Xylariaceae sp. FL0016]|nr:organic solute transporter Ostalpha-domain-containing protein [Xylariaceae sp. FL0016]